MTNVDTEPAQLPPPTPVPVEPTERRWARSEDRVVFGVAGGLARGLAIDPLFVRIAFVVLALFSGVGVLVYVAAALLLANSPTSPQPSIVRRVIGVGAVLISARWLVRGDAHLPDAGWVVAIGLLGIAVALWRGRSSFAPLPQPSPVLESDGGSTLGRWSSWSAQRRERPRRPRSVLGLLTIGAAAVIGAAVWLFNDGVGNRGTLAFGWATAVIGAGLVVGSVAGHARWLFLPAAASAGAALIAASLNFAGVGLANHNGDINQYFGPDASVAKVYRRGAGDVELFFNDYHSDVTTEVQVGIGSARIIVPDDARVVINARVGLGTIDVFDRTRNGYRRSFSTDTASGANTIHLTVDVGVGSVDVQRASHEGFIGGPMPPITYAPFGSAPTEVAVQSYGDGTTVFADGTIQFGDGRRIEADGTIDLTIVAQRPDGSVQLDNGATVGPDGTVTTPGGFVIPTDRRRSPLDPVPTSLYNPGIDGTTTTLGAP